MSSDGTIPPLPHLFNLIGTSFFVSTSAFTVSMLSFGFDSLWSIPAAFGLTFIHHTTLLILEYRAPPRAPPQISYASTQTGIASSAILAVLWLGAFTFVLLTTVSVARSEETTVVDSDSPLWVLITQCVLSALQAVLLAVVVVRSVFERSYGGSGGWRRL